MDCRFIKDSRMRFLNFYWSLIMKKFLVVLFVVLSLSLMSCPSPVEKITDEPFTFQGHWNVYNTDLTYNRVDLYFEGDQYWFLKNDKMTAGGPFTYTDTDLAMFIGSYDYYHGTQKYEIIDKDTVLFLPPYDGMSYLSWNNRIKRSGRTGKMLPVNRHWTFVDD